MRELSVIEVGVVSGGESHDPRLSDGMYGMAMTAKIGVSVGNLTIGNGGNNANTAFQTGVWGIAGAIGGAATGPGALLGAAGGAFGGFAGSFTATWGGGGGNSTGGARSDNRGSTGTAGTANGDGHGF